LTEDWVHANFQAVAIEEWTASPGKWHVIKPGKAKECIEEERLPSLYVGTTELKYPQGNIRNCMVGSFASCLDYIGKMEQNKYPRMVQAGENMIKLLGEIYFASEPYREFARMVIQATNAQYTVIRSKQYNFDQDERLFDMPTLVILTGNDNASDHAIAVYQGMIFDSSHHSILKRCRKTLDWCCGREGFKKIHRAYTLTKVENRNKRQKVR
jgi:hypothetical protein